MGGFCLSGDILTPLRKNVFFISGNGDGGLVDFSMAAFGGQHHHEIVRFVADFPGLDTIKTKLRNIERAARQGQAEFDLLQRYRDTIEVPPLVLEKVRERLRSGTEIWLHTREQHLFRLDTALLNRFIAFLLMEAAEKDSIRVIVGKKLKGDPLRRDCIQVAGDPETITPNYRFLRFGADKKAMWRPFVAFLPQRNTTRRRGGLRARQC